MTARLHVMPESFSGNIVAARMREDAQGRLIATTDPVDVTREAVHAVAYHYYMEARETPEEAVAYEFMLNNGQKVVMKTTIVKEKEETE